MKHNLIFTLPLSLTLNTFGLAVNAQSIIANQDTGTIVQQNGTTYTIQGGITSQDNQNLFHSLQQFGLNNGEIANFLTTPNIHNILTRITGGNPSFINGLLQITGSQANLYIMNPAGIIFGQNAQLNLPADFIATTANAIGFDNNQWFENFNNNSYNNLTGNPSQFAFDYSNNAYIVNQGNLTVNEGKNVTLIAESILNTGVINAPQGTITIASIPQQNTVKISQTGNILNLELLPPRDTQGNPLPFTALSLPELLTGNEINSVIPEERGITVISGELNINGETGGTITLLGNKVALLSANIQANGDNEGGKVLIGGDYQGKGVVFNAEKTYIDSNSLIFANSSNGNGGKVIIWADNSTQFYGKISATGGLNGGDGGFVETSGKIGLDVTNAEVDVTGKAGNTGIWLLDPSHISIIDSDPSSLLGTGGNPNMFSTSLNTGKIEKSTIESALATANVVITTAGISTGNGDITLNISSNLTSASTNSLTLTGREFSNSNTGRFSINGNLTFNLNAVNSSATPSLNSIQNVINSVANSPSVTINLAAGNYSGSTDLSINNSAVSLWSINGVSANQTILTGTGTNSVINISGGVSVDLSNITVTGGQSNYGGGIYTDNSTLNIKNSIISNNLANYSGGGIYNNGGAVNINNYSVISSNYADEGGGVYNNNGTLNLDIYSEIHDNLAYSSGGGIYSNNSYLYVSSSSLISSNSASSGGGIYSNNSILNITNSSIFDNSANGNDGGGIFNIYSTLNIESSTIYNNFSAEDGGGIYNQNSNLNITNSTFSNNSANYGGGIYNGVVGTLTLKQVSIINNSAINSGGGVYLASSTTLYNTLIALNKAPIAPDVFSSLSVDDQGHNLIGITDGSTGWGIKTLRGTLTNPLDPLVTTLGNYGGSTLTYALLPGSPAINAGKNIVGLTTDQRGVPRNGFLDIGAYESKGFFLTVVEGDSQTTLLNEDFIPIRLQLVETGFWTPLSGVKITLDLPPNEDNNPTAILRSPATLTTDSLGTVTFLLSANDVVGNYKVTARLINNQRQTISLTNVNSTPKPIIKPIKEPIIELTPKLIYEPIVDATSESGSGDITTQIQDTQEATVNYLESGLSDTFSEYLGIAKVSEVTVEESRSRLQAIESITGLKPALVYAFFRPQKQDHFIEWRYNSRPQVSKETNQNNDDQLELLVVTSSDTVIQKRLTITRKELLSLVNQFRSSITNIRKPRSYLQPSQELYRVLVGSIESELQQQGINNLTFIMDNGLRAIPLAALHDGQHFIIEKYSVGMMPSLSLTNTEYHDLRNSEVLAMGADTFKEQNPLPGVPVEVNTISQKLWNGESFLNEEFTINNLKLAHSQHLFQNTSSESSQPFSIIHLATHGEFLPGKPSNSYIQFWNEKLTLDRLSELQLNNPPVDLLVLSACRSALGDENAELGFAGFAILAGVKTALGSLWTVSDQGTLALMTNFYTHLKTVTTKAEALREAQLDMIQGKVKFEGDQLVRGNDAIPLPPALARSVDLDLSHPYYWSAFMLVGNPW